LKHSWRKYICRSDEADPVAAHNILLPTKATMPNGFVSIYAVEVFDLRFPAELRQRDGNGGNEDLDRAMIGYYINNATSLNDSLDG